MRRGLVFVFTQIGIEMKPVRRRMVSKPDAKGMESKRSAVSGQRSESERKE